MRVRVKRFLSVLLIVCVFMAVLPVTTKDAMAAVVYNPDAAIAYAAAHATDTPEIAGADCTNFVSKCVTAGGISVSERVCRNLMLALKPYAATITNLDIVLSNGYGRVPTSGNNASILMKGDVMFVCCERCKATGNNYERHAVIYSGQSDTNGYAKCYAHTSMANNTTFWVGYNGKYACSNGHSISYLAAEVVHFASVDTSTPGKSTITGMQRTYASGSNITFNWTATENTTHYNLTLYKLIGDQYIRHEAIHYANSGHTMTLSDGIYRAVVTSTNSNAWTDDGSTWKYTDSEEVYFAVGEHDCDRGSFAFYEGAHPHYSCYKCSFCEVPWRDYTTPNYSESCLECNRPGKPMLLNMKSEYLESNEVVFAWKATTNTTHNSIYIDCKNAQGEWKRYENAHYVENGCTRTLPLGEYRVVLQSTNSKYYEADGSSWLYKDGDFVYFEVVSLESQYPEKPVLDNMKSTYLDGEEIIFTWAATDNTTHYNIYIDYENAQGEWKRYENAHYVENGCTRTLPLGEYRIVLQSTNSEYYEPDSSYWLYKDGDFVYFEVVSLESQYPEKPVLSDMKSSYVDSEEIIFAWDTTENTTHYNFWLYTKNNQNEWESYEHTVYVTSGFERILPVGEYRCLVQSYNSNYWQEDRSDWLYTESDFCYFAVNQSEYTVSYNANGGSGAPASQTKHYDMTLTLSGSGPTRPGYTFLGWAMDSNATIAAYQPGDSLSDNADITLYAVWKKGCESGSHGYDYSITTAPSTSTEGMLTGKCSLCMDVVTVILPKLNATDYNYAVKTAATCTADGTGTYTWKISTYGNYSFNVTLIETGHSYDNGIVTVAATCTQNGVKTYTCTACGDSYNREVPATGHSFEDGLCTVCGEADPDYVLPVTQPTITLKYPSLSFKDEVKVNVYYDVANMDDVVDMGLIVYSSKVSSYTVYNAESVASGYQYNDSYGLYCVTTNGIPAKNMSDTIWFAVYAKLSDGSYCYSKLVDYSPRTYAYTMLGSGDAKLDALLAAMLNYGAAAQTYFDYCTDDLISKDLTADQLGLVEHYRSDMMPEIAIPSIAKQGSFAGTGGFENKYPSVTFGGAFAINYYCVPSHVPVGGITMYYWREAQYNAASVLTADNAAGVVQMTGSGNTYRGSVTGISAKDLSDGVYVAFVYSDGVNSHCSGVLQYSIGMYCNTMASYDNAFNPLAKATAVYGYYAKQYFG